jgi:hypothetical protein
MSTSRTMKVEHCREPKRELRRRTRSSFLWVISFDDTKEMTSAAGPRPGIKNLARRAHKAQPEWVISKKLARNYSGQQPAFAGISGLAGRRHPPDSRHLVSWRQVVSHSDLVPQ